MTTGTSRRNYAIEYESFLERMADEFDSLDALQDKDTWQEFIEGILFGGTDIEPTELQRGFFSDAFDFWQQGIEAAQWHFDTPTHSIFDNITGEIIDPVDVRDFFRIWASGFGFQGPELEA